MISEVLISVRLTIVKIEDENSALSFTRNRNCIYSNQVYVIEVHGALHEVGYNNLRQNSTYCTGIV